MTVHAQLHNNTTATLQMVAATSTVLSLKQAIAVDPVAQVSFQWKNPDFLLMNPDFLLKNVDFMIMKKQHIAALGPLATADTLHLIRDGKRLLDEKTLSDCGFVAGAAAVVMVLQQEFLDAGMRAALQAIPTA